MLTTALIGALLIVCGLLYLAGVAIYRGRLTEPHTSRRNPAGPTLEPRSGGVGFLSLKHNWPGFALAIVGAAFLLWPLL